MAKRQTPAAPKFATDSPVVTKSAKGKGRKRNSSGGSRRPRGANSGGGGGGHTVSNDPIPD